MKAINGCIFDLDGVIVDTAKYHYLAWKKLANQLGFDFSEQDNEKLKGVGRMESLDIILGWGGIEKTHDDKLELADLKNEWYLSNIVQMKETDILPGVISFLEEIKSMNIKMAVGSSSRNASLILEKLNIKHYFEGVSDGTLGLPSKPAPDLFLKAAQLMDVFPSQCVVFEDAETGVDAAIDANMYAVGIGDEKILFKSHMVIPDLEHLSFKEVYDVISNIRKKG